jgi:multidrug transporter EmrE-like cation transporter
MTQITGGYLGWEILFLAILCEVTGTTFMKMSEGFTKPLPIIGIISFYIGAVVFLTLALKHIPMNSAYAVWSGIGTETLAIVGFFFFAETISLWRAFFITLVIIGVIGILYIK